jgi:hypothetical protein
MIDTNVFSSSSNIHTIHWRSNSATIFQPEYDWVKITSRLQELTTLEKGWDGYDAPPVSFENASFALKILEKICDTETLPPQIVPGSNQDLQMEWHTKNGTMELHIVSPYNVYLWTDELDDEISLSTDYTYALQYLRNLMRYQDAEASHASRA